MPEIKKLKTICIHKDGVIEFIYDDDLASFIHGCENKEIFRASHVEPDADGKWYADLSPVKGPKLTGFNTRQEALNAEVKWLVDQYLRSGNESRNQAGSAAEQGTV